MFTMQTFSILHNDEKIWSQEQEPKNLLIALHLLPRIYIMTLAAMLYVLEEYFSLNREVLQFAHGYIRTCLNMAFWRRKASLWAVVKGAELISFGFIGCWSSASALPPFFCVCFTTELVGNLVCGNMRKWYTTYVICGMKDEPKFLDEYRKETCKGFRQGNNNFLSIIISGVSETTVSMLVLLMMTSWTA